MVRNDQWKLLRYDDSKLLPDRALPMLSFWSHLVAWTYFSEEVDTYPQVDGFPGVDMCGGRSEAPAALAGPLSGDRF